VTQWQSRWYGRAERACVVRLCLLQPHKAHTDRKSTPSLAGQAKAGLSSAHDQGGDLFSCDFKGGSSTEVTELSEAWASFPGIVLIGQIFDLEARFYCHVGHDLAGLVNGDNPLPDPYIQ
jgi:hypothetical protein